MITRVWKVFGVEGHRMKESFNDSYKHDFSSGEDTRIIKVENADMTGTNEFSVVRITRNTPEECETEMTGQLYDGVFEWCRVGKVVEVLDDGSEIPFLG